MNTDTELRRQLSQDLRRLVTGRMTNDEFDEVHDRSLDSPDLAVQHVAEFGYGLYSSDVLFPYRLTGSHRVDAATRRMAARCVLFLRTRRPYEWPESPGATTVESLASMASYLGIPTGIILLAVGLPYLAFGERDITFWRSEVYTGAALLLASMVCIVRLPRSLRNRFQQWQRRGDYDVWPFFRREQFYAARRDCYLLGV
jgi:hypothetical protein